MAELGSDTNTYSQVGFTYDGQTSATETSEVPEEQAAAQQHQQQAQQRQQQNNDHVENEDEGYMPIADESTYIPPPQLSVPQGMVVVSFEAFSTVLQLPKHTVTLNVFSIFIYLVFFFFGQFEDHESTLA